MSKGAILGLTRALAQEGNAHNVRVNAVAPVALTRMATGSDSQFTDDPRFAHLMPEHAAPMVGWLAHERCSVNGEVFRIGGHRVASIFVGETAGYFDPTLSVELIDDHFDQIMDRTSYLVPRDMNEDLAWFQRVEE
jgi:hypothetical protein